MKMKTDHYRNTSDFDGRKGSATLNLSKMSLFIDNMVKNYNKPELAVLREWVSNGHDAHVAAGVERQVEVTLPSQLNPTLVVTDFGDGMSSDFVENVYLDFGSSSKDLSNEEIGGFGIGGKSALAIASQYTMATVHNGLKNLYIFERSPLGGVDFKNPIHDQPTDEPSGTVVSVAVDRIDEFSKVNLNRVLGGWKNSEVKINTSKEFFSIPDNSEKTDHGYILNGAFDLTGDLASTSLSKNLDLSWNEHAVLVGPVLYIFTPEVSSSAVMRDWMVASVSIGEVTFPSSREVIEASRANRTFVGECFDALVPEAEELLQNRADKVTDRKAALNLKRSPLARNHRSINILFKGDAIPSTFEKGDKDYIFEYEQTGGWRGPKNYKFADRLQGYGGTEFKLEIKTLVVMDIDAPNQSVRNNLRLIHKDQEDPISEMHGLLVLSPKPTAWMKAAARNIVKASELAAKAKEIRKKIRDSKAAAQAAGIVQQPVAKRTRKDRIGEYISSHLNFKVEEGKLTVESIRGDLMDFYKNSFDPNKTLVISKSDSNYTVTQMAEYLEKFSVNPSDVQFLHVITKAQDATLRVLLGDTVKIQGLQSWMKDNFANYAKTGLRTVSEVASMLPVRIDSDTANVLRSLGLDTLHSKYSEFIALSEELDEIEKFVGGNYYNDCARFVRSLVSSDYGSQKVEARPEFFFLDNMETYRFRYGRAEELSETFKQSLRDNLNFMVRSWLDNLALEEAEAEDEANAVESNNSVETIAR